MADHDPTEEWSRALLEDALAARATDIHIDPKENGLLVRFRIDGTVHDLVTLAKDHGLRLLRYFKVNSGLDPFDALAPEDARLRLEIDGAPLDMRLSCVPCVHGDKLALRLLHRSPLSLSLQELGMNAHDRENIHRWLDDISGIFLVAGPVGSGKTTTLYSLLSELNLGERNLMTVEDPVEYEIGGINQIQIDKRRGVSFDEAMTAILRMDPDYILLGEIRDQASARTAMIAASTGRVVLTTMHSRNAAGVITALRGLGVRNHEIAASLGFVVAQRLVRKLCSECRTREAPTDAEKRWLESINEPIPAEAWHPKGCERCEGTGYHGRIGIFETLPIDGKTYHMILGGEDELTLRQHLRKSGFRPLLRDGLEKAIAGITSLEELTRIGAQTYLENTLEGK
jgi:general secretion pathway protein E